MENFLLSLLIIELALLVVMLMSWTFRKSACNKIIQAKIINMKLSKSKWPYRDKCSPVLLEVTILREFLNTI